MKLCRHFKCLNQEILDKLKEFTDDGNGEHDRLYLSEYFMAVHELRIYFKYKDLVP